LGHNKSPVEVDVKRKGIFLAIIVIPEISGE
jgi:hypothetical protein